MHFFFMTFRLGLLIVVVCIALSSCSKLFSPRGSGKIPDTDQTETAPERRRFIILHEKVFTTILPA